MSRARIRLSIPLLANFFPLGDISVQFKDMDNLN